MVLGTLSEVLGGQPSPFGPDPSDALSTSPTVLTDAGYPAPIAGEAAEPPADSHPPSPSEFAPLSPPPSPPAFPEPESAASSPLFAEPASAPATDAAPGESDHLVSPDPAEPDRPWTPSAWASDGATTSQEDPASDAAATSLATDAGADSRAESATGEEAATRHTAIRVEAGNATAISPSLARRAASLVLDLLLLLVLPAAIVTGPVAYLALGRMPADLWTGSGGLLLPFFLVLFVLLEALYLGAFGRTPGLRLAGLQVVDERGAVPSFGVALLRSLTFPIVLIPVLEGVSRTRTVGEP